MRQTDIFPITKRAVETAHYTSSPHEFRSAFLDAYKNAVPRGTWYAFDVIIHTSTEVEFVVYDMRDNFSGGLGAETARVRAIVPTATTDAAIDAAVWHAAGARRASELDAEEHSIVARYASEIRLSLAAETPSND